MTAPSGGTLFYMKGNQFMAQIAVGGDTAAGAGTFCMGYSCMAVTAGTKAGSDGAFYPTDANVLRHEVPNKGAAAPASGSSSKPCTEARH